MSETSWTYAIDYDGTWTSDPIAFRAFATLLRRRGHKVVIVTARVSGQGEVREACMEYVDDIVWSTGMPKREAAERAGFTVKVWIDDMPEMIVRGPRA